MLFNPRPKTRREDLFDRERELNALHRAAHKPLILVTGIRRIGKTSLINVFLNEVDATTIIIDLRSLKPNYGYRELYELLSQALTEKAGTLVKLLRNIRGVKVVGLEIELKWRGRNAASLATIIDALNRGGRTIIAFDEAQKLRGPRAQEVLEAIAHAYDYDENITIILTGSEIGLLLEFVGIDNPKSPLYGRYAEVISVERFTKEQSIRFLKRGFEEAGIRAREEQLEEVVNVFDGIPGWLTFYGNLSVSKGAPAPTHEARELAVKIALNELRNLIKARSRRYAYALKAIAKGAKTWARVKEALEEAEGTTISSSVLHNVLTTLEKLSIIRNYEFLDPIYREAAAKL